jgi:hypothetical protein
MKPSPHRSKPFANPVTRLVIASSVLLAITIPAVPPADAQVSGAGVINTDPAINGRHLRDAVTLGQNALERLQGPSAVEELATTHQTIDLMYRTVRLALFGLREKKKETKFDDPMLDYELGRTGKAWDIIRGPVDRYFDGLPPEVYIERAIRDLQEAIAILRPVAAVMQ